MTPVPADRGVPGGVGAGATHQRRRLRQARALIIGTAIILVGVVISPLPGPGLTVLGPLGLGILAGEFLWAKRVRQRLESGERSVRGMTDRVAVQISRWFIVPVIGAYCAGAWLVHSRDLMPEALFWALAFPTFVPVGYLALRIAAVRARRRAQGRASAPTAEPAGPTGGPGS